MRKVELSWNKKNQKLLDRAMNPLYRQQRMLGLMDSSDEETEDENTKAALKQAEDCIVKGHVMRHSRFKKVWQIYNVLQSLKFIYIFFLDASQPYLSHTT